MNDTPEYIFQKQVEIIASKPIAKRVEMSLEMINLVYTMAKYRFEKQQPILNKGELISQLFLDFYRDDFSEEEKTRICESIQQYHK
jgi:hypothetical protein